MQIFKKKDKLKYKHQESISGMKGGREEGKDALWPHHKMGSIFLACGKVTEALPRVWICVDHALWCRNRLQV